MWNKITLISLQLIFIILLSGCVKSLISQQAHFYPICPTNHYALYLKQETSRIMFNICEGFVFVIKIYDFDLPTKPEGRVIYPYSIIKLRVTSERENSIGDFTSGAIVVDMNSRMVSISLETQEGYFQGNGEYPINEVEISNCTPSSN